MSTADLPPEIRPLIEAMHRFHDAYRNGAPRDARDGAAVSQIFIALSGDRVAQVLEIYALSRRAQDLLAAAIDLATVELLAQQATPDSALLADLESAFTAEDQAAYSTHPFNLPLNDEPDGGQQS